MSGRNDNKVKNRAPAAMQITAEQLIREASERQVQTQQNVVNKIGDSEEYQSQQRVKRKGFEDELRRQREHLGTWVKYAKFEEENKELERARSIYERALEVDHRGPQLWLKYAEFEMRNEFVNHARNVWDRAVAILPRVDQLWYKYTYMEEMVGDVPKARTVFERWMKWAPDDNAWLSYARFEGRCGDIALAKDVLERYCESYPSTRSYLKYARWAEHDAKDVILAREVFERTLSELEVDEVTAKVFTFFASFEERHGEHDRARIIYRHAVDLFKLGSSNVHKVHEDSEDVNETEQYKRSELYKHYVAFEKKHGSKDGVENLILTKQRSVYRLKVAKDGADYDSWFDWAKLEETHGEAKDVRDVYERAVANVPPAGDKKHWKRYIYLWINYALYEELVADDADQASEVLKACLSLIPHRTFSFSKVWIMAAHNHVRRHDLKSARSLLGRAIGLSGKEKIFSSYIALELALGEVDRCRQLYAKYLQVYPSNASAWMRYAELESNVGETERSRAILELAVSQDDLDMPEMLWKSYIDFEVGDGAGANARRLFERLLAKTGHVKVWMSFGLFEGSEVGGGMDRARSVFKEAYGVLKNEELKEERVLLLDAWRGLEKSKNCGVDKIAAVEAMMPRRIKKKRMKTDEVTGAQLGWEEYYDYHFPDDKAGGGNMKLLEMAAKWKANKRKAEEIEAAAGNGGGGEGSVE